MQNNHLLTVKEASEYLRVHRNTVYKWVREGKIPFLLINGQVRFKKEEINEWLNQRSLKNISLLEDFAKVDLSLDSYDRLFLEEVKVGQKGKTWRYPFGSVYLRLTKSGERRWYIYYRVDGERIREVVKNAQSRTDSVKVLQVKVADALRAKHGFKREEKRVKFKKFSVEYIEDYAKKNKRSWKQDDYCIAKLNKYFGGSYLLDINSHDIERFKSSILSKKISEPRVNRYLALLKKMFNLAVDWGYIQENPAKRVKLFTEDDSFQVRILSLEEERKLLENCSEHLRPIVVTALNTGMRRGEILSMKWVNVDLSKRQIRVDKTNSKSKKSKVIPINSTLFHELVRLKERNGSSDYVFLNPQTGKPLAEIKTAFNAAKRRSGIDGLRFHDLRHTVATRLLERGVDLITVRDLLGHHSVTITQRYTHSRPDQKMRAVEGLVSESTKKSKSVPVLSTRERHISPNDLFTVN